MPVDTFKEGLFEDVSEFSVIVYFGVEVEVCIDHVAQQVVEVVAEDKQSAPYRSFICTDFSVV